MNPTGLQHISEEEKLKLRLQLTHEERFRLLMRLIKIQKMLQSATIVHHDKKEN